ncbi:MAG: hypothetical protein KGQ81_03260, partial [Cyanobacteria bacterium REEB498]|nr:hypothetical protein [Cyanobacteria bacterium REEB498]
MSVPQRPPLSALAAAGLPGAALSLSLLALGLPRPAEAGMIEQLIYNKCAAAMQADYEQAGKVPPAGMVDFTCTCVVQKIFSQQSIHQAKTACTQLALKK